MQWSDVRSPWFLIFHDVTLVLQIHRTALENKNIHVLSFNRVNQPRWYFSFFVYCLTDSSRIRWRKDGGNREDPRRSRAVGGHMLSAEWRSPVGVLKKAVSASPWWTAGGPLKPVLCVSLSARLRVPAALWAGCCEILSLWSDCQVGRYRSIIGNISREWIRREGLGNVIMNWVILPICIMMPERSAKRCC